ncbi:hypothetical protein D4764_22G0000460 [Takifugu flavidus]|uniref:Uncharacterized protein n=1 Tax=Takifugu flavidus TaxID=433684 RepID=A0A5C6NCA5_9TELE|nr:hypothetical protein D4764_22G0000460 [Takifugu flavidus]
MNMRRDEHQTQTHSHSPCYQHWVLMRWQRRQDVTGRRRGDSSNLEPGAPGSTGTWTWRKARTPPALGPTVPSKGPSACWTTIRQNHQIMSFYAVDSLLHPQSSRAVMLLLVNILKDLLRTLQVEPPPTQPNRVQPEFFTRMEMRDRRRCCTEAFRVAPMGREGSGVAAPRAGSGGPAGRKWRPRGQEVAAPRAGSGGPAGRKWRPAVTGTFPR